MARKFKVADVSVAQGGHAPVDSAVISQNKGVVQGTMVGFKATASNWAGASGFTLGIKDSDGDTIYTSAEQAKGGTRIVMGLTVPLCEKEKVTIDLVADPGAGGGTVTNITIYYTPDAIIP